MALIEAYEFTVRPIHPMTEAGGYNKLTGKFVRFKTGAEAYQVLDAIAAAAEAGKLDTEKWVRQVFVSKSAFMSFLEDLADWDEIFRITDQWWEACSRITGFFDEELFTTASEVADRLLEAARETGQV